MTTLLTAPVAPIRTVADLMDRLGNIPPARVLVHVPMGLATEADVIEIARREKRLCELIEGVLVEKALGYRESLLAFVLGGLLRDFVVPRNLGLVSGADGMMRLFPGMVRIPDVALASWDRIPGGRVPTEPLPSLVPDLAIEVLSEGNTPAEMARKCREYFAAGVRLVWMVDPETRKVSSYSAPERSVTLGEEETLDGGDVLPGFALPLHDLFAELDRQGPQ